MFGNRQEIIQLTHAVDRVADAIERQTARMAQLDREEAHDHEENGVDDLFGGLTGLVHERMLEESLNEVITAVLGEDRTGAEVTPEKIERIKREFQELTGHTVELKWVASLRRFNHNIDLSHDKHDHSPKPKVSRAEHARRSKAAKKAAATRKHNKAMKENK